MFTKIYDITQTLYPGIAVYPGDPLFTFEKLSDLKNGNLVNLSKINMCLHTGTHIDAPCHFFENGLSIEQLPWKYLMGTTKVFELKVNNIIKALDLKSLEIVKDDIILIKTNNSSLLSSSDFNPQYTYLTVDAAEYLAEIGILTIGFDYLTVDRYGDLNYPVHHTLLGNNIVIIEGLNLSEIEPGEYQMMAMPLKIKDADGSPARIILYKLD